MNPDIWRKIILYSKKNRNKRKTKKLKATMLLSNMKWGEIKSKVTKEKDRRKKAVNWEKQKRYRESKVEKTWTKEEGGGEGAVQWRGADGELDVVWRREPSLSWTVLGEGYRLGHASGFCGDFWGADQRCGGREEVGSGVDENCFRDREADGEYSSEDQEEEGVITWVGWKPRKWLTK